MQKLLTFFQQKYWRISDILIKDQRFNTGSTLRCSNFHSFQTSWTWKLSVCMKAYCFDSFSFRPKVTTLVVVTGYTSLGSYTSCFDTLIEPRRSTHRAMTPSPSFGQEVSNTKCWCYLQGRQLKFCERVFAQSKSLCGSIKVLSKPKRCGLESDAFFAYRIRISACLTWTDNCYLTHVISPRTR